MSKECTLHNLITSCRFNQAFWIFLYNNHDQNVLIAKGSKEEILTDAVMSFDVVDHINDVVEYWTIREDGAMFVRLRWDKSAEDEYGAEYIKRWDRAKPSSRPYLYSAELDDFTNCIYGSGEYQHPYGDPMECHTKGSDDKHGGLTDIDTVKYIICCPLCDNRKCVRGTDLCEAEIWARSKKEEGTDAGR